MTYKNYYSEDDYNRDRDLRLSNLTLLSDVYRKNKYPQINGNSQLSSLVTGQKEFVDPGFQRSFGHGLIYKSSPESSTEYYDGPNAEVFYNDYMARKGFGNMRSTDAGAVERAIQRDNDAYYRRG